MGFTPDRACGRRERSRADVQLRHTSTVRLKQNGAGCWEELLVYDIYIVCMYVTCMYVYIYMYVCMCICMYVCNIG